MFKDILLPIDILEKSSWNTALPVAISMVRAYNAKLHIMTVVPEYGMNIIQQHLSQSSIDQIIQKTSDDLHLFTKNYVPEDIKVQYIVGRGAVYDCIIETAEAINADLIIMASHRPELKDYLLGPNAARVVRHSTKSVLVVRDSLNKEYNP